MHVSLCAVILFTSTFAVTYGQRADAQDDCRSQETCTACIRSRSCTWCDIVVDDRTQEPPIRCIHRQDPLAQGNRWCNGGNREDRTTTADIVQDDPLSWDKRIKQVQITPQIVNLKLRRGEEYRLKMRYRQAEDYPVDLYFLVDLSYSMLTFRNNLSQLGDRIVRAMKSLSSNIQLGFGSFVDKHARPMIYGPRSGDREDHYSYKNQMPLTKVYDTFQENVHNSPLIGTWDAPEGGFDAIMQAIVCTEEINWRLDARHLLVHVSDDVPHVAGDGRLAGMPKPNDEECHLNASAYYSHAELQDFPSIAQINRQAMKHNINIIFASVERYKAMYEAVRTGIQGSSVGIFDARSDKVIELISAQYEKLVRSLKMTSNSTFDFLDVKFFSRCTNKYGKPLETDKCDGLRVNDTIEFEVAIKAIDCPQREEDWHQIIEIKPEGIRDRMIVNVELLCGCKCSKKVDKGKTAPRAEVCHNSGVLDCGVCSCDQGFYGKSCQCQGAKATNSNDKDSCRRDNSSMECSGHGSCICGSCNCDKLGNSEQHFYGKFCQCDDFSCRYVGGKLCGGNGRCECGECKCNSGWSGPDCDCRDDITLCLPPGDNATICSGAGECKCGRCRCKNEMGRDGKFCEECLTCPSQRCDEFEDCVECLVHKSGKLYEEDKTCLKCSVKIIKVDEIEEDPDKEKPEGHLCLSTGDDGSTFVFTYTYGNDEDNKVITILAKREKDFPVIGNFLAATLGVVILTVVLGLLTLLIWKLVTHEHDRREYKKFVKDSSLADWGQNQNPLYKDVVTRVKNPTFHSESGQVDI